MNMDEKVLILDGDENIVDEFKDALLKLGMISIELDISTYRDDEIYVILDSERQNEYISFEQGAFFGKRNECKFTSDIVDSIIPLVAAVIGSGGLTALITSILNANKGEGEFEIDEKGRFTKITFKNMSPKKVTEIIEAISKVVK